MTDRPDRLEAELSGMQPLDLPAELTERIGSSLSGIGSTRSPWPDRCLLSAMGAGALAACVIVAILLGLPRTSESGDESKVVVNSTNMRTDVPRFGDSPLALGRGSAAWIDNWK